MLRRILYLCTSLFMALALTGSADAQIIGVTFKTEKAAKKFKKYLVEFRGEPMVIGEPLSGFRYNPDQKSLSYVPAGSNSMIIGDPSKPQVTTYTMVKGEIKPKSKKYVLSIPGNSIKSLHMIMRSETLPGLAREYVLRTDQLEEFEDARDDLDKTTTEWASSHVRLVTAMERLELWLRSTAFPDAARKLAKAILKEKKSSRNEAIQARWKKAEDSVQKVEVAELLQELAATGLGKGDKFGAMASQHIRVYYIKQHKGSEELLDTLIQEALEVGEQAIEGFRAEFVDPYLGEDYKDHIPDGLFLEFLFVPDKVSSFEYYAKGFYGIRWGENREASLAMAGGRSIGGETGPRTRAYWKNKPNLDLAGVVCHQLGHTLAALHYGLGRHNIPQDWISEALGYYLSFENLGRNNVTCKAFHKDKEPGYLRRDIEHKKEGDKTVTMGRRDIFNEVALSYGRPIDQLALRILFEMDDADLAKAWSFYDYLSRKEGKQGQMWLRAAAKHANNKKTFITKWREAAAQILEVDPGLAFRSVEDRWKAYAGNDQDTSDGKRKKK